MIDEENNNQKDLCSEHHLKMRYFCEDCVEAFCPDCGAFSNKHKGHKIKLISDVYSQERQRIQKELNRFDTRYDRNNVESRIIRLRV